ncbi:hypothetical protein GWD52_17515 [Enterobacteriaceae bacterium 4M9]|nr:hypothetical protein [Enterobacteriaceae bacterium 4M9]
MQINAEIRKQVIFERERLKSPPLPTHKATGVGIARFIVACDSNALATLSLAKEVLSIVNAHSLEQWPTLEDWKTMLPSKFVNRCLQESQEEQKIEAQKKWEQLSYDEKIKAAALDEQWALSSWLSWLEPEGREWFWWNAILFDEPLDETHFLVEVTVLDSPFMSGALKWLFKASGALSVVSEDDV